MQVHDDRAIFQGRIDELPVKFRNRIGIDVAIEALREFVQRRPGKIDSLLRHAKVDRVERVIRPYLESVA
ncbi:MAG: hypothetical protein ACKOEX_10475 [Planctomycetia bacterium]